MSDDEFSQEEGSTHERSKYEKVCSLISAKFAENFDFNSAIEESLEEIGILSGADRSYLFGVSREEQTISNTHEWCAYGVEPQKHILQKISYDSLPWWMNKLEHNEIIHITDVKKLPEKAKVKELLETQNIKSLLVFPISVKGELKAFIGFDNIKETGEWEKHDFELLKIVSDIIGSAFERQQLEEEINESQILLKNLASTANDGIIIINNENKIIFWNKSAEKIFGYKEREVLNLPLIDVLIPRKYRELVESRFKSFKENLDKEWYRKVNHSFITNKYGVQIPVEVSHSMTNIKGKRYGFAIVRDLTKRKEFEQILNVKDQAIESSINAIAFADLNGIITYVNQAFLKLWGYEEKDEILGRNSLDFWKFRGDAAKVVEAIRKEGAWSGELEAKRKDKSLFEVKVAANMIFNNDDNPICMMGIFLDITERKKQKITIEKQITKYRQLFERSSNMIILLNTSLEIIDVNPAFLNFTGFNLNEVKGKTLHEVKATRPENLITYSKKIRKLFKDGEVEDLEVEVKNVKNEKRWLLIKGSKINLQDEIIVQIIMEDITEQKQIQENLKEINRIKTHIFRRASHELKTPLISIKGFTDILLRLHHDKFSEEIIEIINEIKNGSLRLEKLVQEILQSSQLDSNKIKLDKNFESLKSIFEDAINDVNQLAFKRNIIISNKYNQDCKVFVERERIYEVILNLLTNAIKYTKSGGEVNIDCELKDNFHYISVQDNGIGLTKTEKENLFREFGKIKRPNISGIDTEGSGLGLYISKRIIELHGGEIWVESEGRYMGSKFVFTLPKKENEPPKE